MNSAREIEHLTDEELIEKYLETQRHIYFDPIYNRYIGKVYGKCLSILRDEAAAKDAAQDIFIKVLLSLSKFKKGSRFSTWLYSVSYNFCIDQIRKSKKNKTQDIADLEYGLEDNSPEVSDAQLLEIRVLRLNEILKELQAAEKMILLMKYQDAMSIADIAELMDITESAVKMRLKRAKAKVVKLHDEKYND